MKKQLVERFPGQVKFGPAEVEEGRGTVMVQVTWLTLLALMLSVGGGGEWGAGTPVQGPGRQLQAGSAGSLQACSEVV